MPRYLIQRDLPNIGQASQEDLSNAAKKSNEVLAAMQSENKAILWKSSFVSDNQTFCIYESESEALIHEHAERSGFPANNITEIKTDISPATASD